MLKLLKALRQDEYGVILSAEIVIVGTLLVLGVMTGMVCLQKSVNGELGDLAKAVDSIDQTFSYSPLVQLSITMNATRPARTTSSAAKVKICSMKTVVPAVPAAVQVDHAVVSPVPVESVAPADTLERQSTTIPTDQTASRPACRT
jgi:hypothetical protein